MSWLKSLSKIFKKEETIQASTACTEAVCQDTNTVTNPSMGVQPQPGPYLIDTSTPQQPPAKTFTQEEVQKQFDTWYAALPENKKKQVDKQILKAKLKIGSPVVCAKCKKPGGKIGLKGYTLKKVGDVYCHVGDCPEV